MDNSVELEQVDALQELEDASTIIEQEEGTGVNDEIDDEAIIEGASNSSVQIAPTGESNPIAQEYNDPMLFVQLGDRVVFDSKKYGRTIGSVYYRSLERISIKPDGFSNT